MAIEIDYTFMVDGLFHSINYYRSETPMDVGSMPAPTISGISTLSFTDTTATKGKYYFVRLGSVKGSDEKISEEIRVLAGTLWTPANMTTNKDIWLDSDSIVSSSGLITQWTDKAGVNNFTTGATSVRPSIGSLNGYNIAIFDGVSDYLTNLSSRTIFKNTGSGWCFSISKRISGGNILSHNCSATRPTNLRFGFADVFGSSRTDTGAIINTPFGIPDNVWAMSVFEANWSGGKYYHTLNGQSKLESPSFTAGLTSNTDSANGTTIGRYTPSDTINRANCELACLIMGGSALPTEDEINRLMGWAAWKWDLVGSLPVGHPYKNAPPVI